MAVKVGGDRPRQRVVLVVLQAPTRFRAPSRNHRSQGSFFLEIAVLTSAFVASVASGLVPFVNAEVVVVAAAVAVPSSQQWLVVAVCSLGQMIAKALLYAFARWLPQRLPARAVRHLERASEKAKRIEQAGWSLILVSAIVGLPPFYVISLASGMVRVNFAAFLAIGFVGRYIRFAILAYGAVAAGGAIQGGL